MFKEFSLTETEVFKFDTLWVSDVHLGTPQSEQVKFLEFLKKCKVKKLIIVGDFIDVIAMQKKVFWDTTTSNVLKQIFKMARKGVEVIYVPGNHDYQFRAYDGARISGVKIEKKHIHYTPDGVKYLVKHGDEFDGIIRKITWLYHIGDWAYAILIKMNKPFNRLRRVIGFRRDWSLSMYLKTKVKGAIQLVNHFEKLVVTKAREYEVDGVICGHIHVPEDKAIDDIHYINTGCWVEGCSFAYEKNGKVKVAKLV
jgi:UDP-2,3-diacylglucosamine pyrophosphatase LpxH